MQHKKQKKAEESRRKIESGSIERLRVAESSTGRKRKQKVEAKSKVEKLSKKQTRK